MSWYDKSLEWQSDKSERTNEENKKKIQNAGERTNHGPNIEEAPTINSIRVSEDEVRISFKLLKAF